MNKIIDFFFIIHNSFIIYIYILWEVSQVNLKALFRWLRRRRNVIWGRILSRNIPTIVLRYFVFYRNGKTNYYLYFPIFNIQKNSGQAIKKDLDKLLIPIHCKK